jgi:iron only hydrogenase large subunit-like protein
VTSAETILIQEQSYEKLVVQLSVPVDQRPTIVVALSPNSLASIAAFLNMSAAECFLRIATALKQLGVTYVFDTSSAGDIALIEAREEFLLR